MKEVESGKGELEEVEAEELVAGQVWSIGSFVVAAGDRMTTGFQIIGETDDGREVTFNLMPGEVKALDGLIQAHKDAIDYGVERYKGVKSPTAPVCVRVPGSGPAPIPTNKGALDKDGGVGAST